MTISRNHDAFSDMYRVLMNGPLAQPDLARARVPAQDVDSTLRQIAELLSSQTVDGVSVTDVHAGLRTRENVSSTNIGSGIAMPHFIDTNVRSTRVVVLTLERPINWGSDSDPVDIVFGLSGAPQEPWRHVRCLAHLARLSLLPGFAERLRDAQDDNALRRVFAEEYGRHG